MFKKLLFLSLLIPFISFGQCLTCAKNLGSHTDDFVADFKKSVDGMYFLKNGSPTAIYKYDFNCNLLWNLPVGATLNKMVSDPQGNIYVLVTYGNTNTGGPYIVGGLSMYPGLNLLKFDTNGNSIWTRSLGLGISYGMRDVFINNSTLYVTGTFVQNITICNQTTFNFPYNGMEKAFVAKLNLAGDLLDAKDFGTGFNTYAHSEIDGNGNIYLSSFKRGGNAHSDIYKIDSNLQPVWSIEISNDLNGPIQSIYEPRYLHYNPLNNKLYLWGLMRDNVTILGNLITGNSSGVENSVLTEFNVQTGALERFKKIGNISLNWGMYVNPMPSAYMAGKGNDLYILTNFRNTLQFTNSTVTSSLGVNGRNYDLVLFKVDMTSFDSDFIIKSSSNPSDPYGPSQDMAGPMFFINNSLYLSSTFESKPLTINGTTINNNSGNGDFDAMFYRYDFVPNTGGTIDVTDTCLNAPTNFNLSGSFDTVSWDFDNPASGSNTASINNPQHQFSAPGSYHVTVTVTCGSNAQTLFTDVVINNQPNLASLPPIIECEAISGSGVAAFDTSTITSQLIGSQSNVTLEFRKANGTVLTSPLPNPYMNSNAGGDIITVRAFYTNNPGCYIETNLQFSTMPRSPPPTAVNPQKFCIQQNATLNDIGISSGTIQWHDAATNGNSLPTSTALQDGTIYYASQTTTGCESSRIPVNIQIQNTAAPTGTNQSFCATQNATVNDIIANGTAIRWYASLTSTTPLAASTLLTDATTYYATQTVNGCESFVRLPVTISLIFGLNATNYAETICDNGNDGEVAILANYNSFLIGSVAGNTFTYYNTFANAQTESPVNRYIDYSLNLGLNTLYARIDSSNGCHQIVELQLTLVQTPVIILADEVTLCENERVVVTANSGFDSYSWSTGSISQSTVITQAGNYSLTVTENHGAVVCSSIKNFTVVLSNAPTISQIDIVDWTDNQNSITVNLSPISIGNYEYSTDGEHFQASNVFNGLANGVYTVTVRDINGCGIATQEVYLLNYPKFFTPNGDGFNDYWHIRFSQFEPNFSVNIFDRYGKLLKAMNNAAFWDGTLNGKILPSDDYWFSVIREDGRIHKGHFALKR